MLKALELVGFKSFADKTRLEFPRGITAVVGPNGSGKSNVVDAIKWVLGEQSVKSLRGKEMADVIFNGSASRSALQSAEVTLTFDNAEGRLPIDTPEVHITRRVYRSGEGEYLINRQPSRLRDIRDLFSGTGVATEAYSVIEQGKVDVMLQSSPRDRRMIFEEAAGISRFKAKKVESLRRLERVEQNLLRLSDIVQEVESRLRSVRLQAGKARRYKEYTNRLQELRTQVSLADYRALGLKLGDVQNSVARLTAECTAHDDHVIALEAETIRIDASLAETDQRLHHAESRYAQNREQIAACESTIVNQRGRLRDLEDEMARYRRQLAAMNVRAGDIRQQLQSTDEALIEAEQTHAQLSAALESRQQELQSHLGDVAQRRARHDVLRSECLEQTRTAAIADSQATALEAQIESACATRDRCEQRIVEFQTQRAALEDEIVQLRAREQELAATAESAATMLADEVAALEQLREARQQLADRLNQLRHDHDVAAERAAVLADLERRHEGLGAGVQQLLAAARRDDSPYRAIRGVVADLLRAPEEVANCIDAALGEAARYLVVDGDDAMLQQLQRDATTLPGRVGVVVLPGTADTSPWPTSDTLNSPTDLSVCDGVRGRADQFVETAPEHRRLAARMLGSVWLVDTLERARTLAAGQGRGASFVTAAGEFLAADGTLHVGPRDAAVGLISRRSELRALEGRIADWRTELAAAEVRLADLDRDLQTRQQAVARATAERQQALRALDEHRVVVGSGQSRLEQLLEQLGGLEAELAAATENVRGATSALELARQRQHDAEARLATLNTDVAEAAAQLATAEKQLQAVERHTTAARVELAKSEERLDSLRSRKRQCEKDQQERARALAEAASHLEHARSRSRQTEFAILDAESQAAELFLLKEQLARESGQQVEQREQLRSARIQAAQQANDIRHQLRQLEEALRDGQVRANQLQLERANLADRLRDDYGIELADLEHVETPEEQHQREVVDQEIADLRRKINNIGNVNLDALAEVEELESRFAHLSEQYEDLAKAKRLLEQIIGKINADSRRMFAETLEIVRGHFQNLFRKLFGGGQADVVLEEGVDILDSGIEIVARPPGKEPRNISLLSGGEKTLTCVALLLAIFQYRPSPFCVLDEVDAALDEANIERFIAVLQEFLTWTQFIVVTHSKKTMTCADTLYGVTMQESGVSKRVSVRFEDVSENGEIRLPADGLPPADRADTTDGDETQAA